MARPFEQAREDARARGDTRYLSVRPCPLDHVGERYVINSACCTCADMRRAEKLGRPYVPPVRPKITRPVVEPEQPSRQRIELSAALASYFNSPEARARSRHLDRLTRELTASATKAGSHAQERH